MLDHVSSHRLRSRHATNAIHADSTVSAMPPTWDCPADPFSMRLQWAEYADELETKVKSQKHCERLTTMTLQEQSQAAAALPPVPAHVVQEHVKPQWPHSSSAALLQYAPIWFCSLSTHHACVNK